MIRNIGCYVPGLWPKPSTCEQGRSFHLSVRRDTSKRTSAVRGEGAFRILSIANNSDLMHLRLKDLKGSGEDGAVPVASLIPWNVVVHRHFGQKVVPPQFDVGCRAMSRFIEGQIREWKLKRTLPGWGNSAFGIQQNSQTTHQRSWQAIGLDTRMLI